MVLFFCSAAEANRKAHVVTAAVRMAVVLAVMLACDITRAAVLFVDTLTGVTEAVRYYVGYMFAEAVPIIPIIVLAAVTFYNARVVDYAKLAQRKAAVEGVPLLHGDAQNDTDSPSQYDY